MNAERPRIVVIGGGITGLAAAHRIIELSEQAPAERRPSVLLLEASDRLGGVIRSAAHEDCLIELGPDSFITQKPWALELCRRLGLQERIIQTSGLFRRAFVVHRGRMCPVPEGFMMLAPTQWWPFISSPLFSPLGKLRMALDLVLPRGKKGKDESLSRFVLRRLGREALERAAQPLIGGIYTADPERLSLMATMPRFLELEEKYGSVIKGMIAESKSGASGRSAAGSPDGAVRYSLFVTLDRGMSVLVERLAERIGADNLRTAARAGGLARDPAGGAWTIELSGGETIAADAVIVSLPARAASALLAGIDEELAGDLGRIRAASSAAVNFVFRRSDIAHPLDSFGFVVPAIERRSVVACTFSSAKFAGRAPADKVVLRAFLGGALAPQIIELSDDTLLEAAMKDLRELLGISGAPLASLVSRFPSSMPQYDVGHLDLVSRIEARAGALPGLALAGNAYHGVGIPDCVRSGEQAAETVVRYLANR